MTFQGSDIPAQIAAQQAARKAVLDSYNLGRTAAGETPNPTQSTPDVLIGFDHETGAELHVPVGSVGGSVSTGTAGTLIAHFAWQSSTVNGNAGMPNQLAVVIDPRVPTNSINFTPEALNVPGGSHYVIDDASYVCGYANNLGKPGFGFSFKCKPLHRYIGSVVISLDLPARTADTTVDFQQLSGKPQLVAEPSDLGDFNEFGIYTGSPSVSVVGDGVNVADAARWAYVVTANDSVYIDFVAPDTDPTGWYMAVRQQVPSSVFVDHGNGDAFVVEYGSVNSYECSIWDMGEQPVTFPAP